MTGGGLAVGVSVCVCVCVREVGVGSGRESWEGVGRGRTTWEEEGSVRGNLPVVFVPGHAASRMGEGKSDSSPHKDRQSS